MKRCILIAFCFCLLLQAPTALGAKPRESKTDNKKTYKLEWAPKPDDFVVWSMKDLNKASTITGPGLNERLFLFGRMMTKTGRPTGAFERWKYKYFLSLATYLTGKEQKVGDSWKRSFHLFVGMKVDAEYKMVKVIQVANLDKNGTHTEIVITGKGKYVNYINALDKKLTYKLNKKKLFKCQWTVHYDPARKIITRGTVQIDISYFNTYYTVDKKEDKKNPYDRDKYKSTKKLATNEHVQKFNVKFDLEKYYKEDHPEFLFVRERSDVIKKGVAYLYNTAQVDGSFQISSNPHKIGQTALGLYALLKCEEKIDTKKIVRALDYIISKKTGSASDMYSVCLVILAVEEFLYRHDRIKANKLEKKKYKKFVFDSNRIKKLEKLLDAYLAIIKKQFIQKGSRAWGYIKPPQNDKTLLKRVDHSNTQFVALALTALRRRGKKIDPEFWTSMLDTLIKAQAKSGSWNYGLDWADSVNAKRQTVNMTLAGLSSVIFAKVALKDHKDLDKYKKAIDNSIKSASKYLSTRYTEWDHRGSDLRKADYYYLYSLERAATLAGIKKFKKKSWYKENSLVTFQLQMSGGPWPTEYGQVVSTSFALLFLKRATTSMVN